MKELTSVIVILCHRWCAKPVNSTRANTKQQTQLVFMSACWVPRESGILSLSIAQWDCANASYGSTHIPAIQTQGHFGNCLCAGPGTHKGTMMHTLRAYRASQEVLGPGEGCTCICIDNSSGSSRRWSSTVSASQWTLLTRGKKRSVKLWPPGTQGTQRW